MENLAREYGATRRRIKILKLRGSSFREGFHDYCIIKGRLVRDSSALRPIQCILTAMFQIGGFMLGDQFNNAGPEP
jgi:hypothetical protein